MAMSVSALLLREEFRRFGLVGGAFAFFHPFFPLYLTHSFVGDTFQPTMGVVQDNSIFPPPTAELPESIWMGARYVTDTWMSCTGGKYFTAPALT